MSAPVDSSGLDRLIGQTLQALGQLRGEPAAAEGDGSEAEPVEGVGHGADGLIRATAAVGGRLSGLELDSRVMRMSSASLAEEILAAVNAALADLQERIREAAAGPNLDAIAEQLKEVQEESTRQMGTFLQALVDAQERIASGAGVDMNDGVQISTDVLRATGTGLGQVGDQLEQQLNALESELMSFGEPWGNDDIGSLIGVAYQEVVSWAFECLREVLNEIRQSGSDLGAMAERYDELEQNITNSFNNLLSQIGG